MLNIRMLNNRRGIVIAWAGSLLLAVLALFSGGLGGLLLSLGDEIGAKAAWGATCVFALGFLILHIMLVTLLALAFLVVRIEQSPSDDERS